MPSGTGEFQVNANDQKIFAILFLALWYTVHSQCRCATGMEK